MSVQLMLNVYLKAAFLWKQEDYMWFDKELLDAGFIGIFK